MPLAAPRRAGSGGIHATRLVFSVVFALIATAACPQTGLQQAPAKAGVAAPAADKAAADKAAVDKAAADKAAVAGKAASSVKIASVAVFPQAVPQTASQPTSQDFILEINGTDLDKIGDITQAYIALLPPTGVATQIPVFFSPDKSKILAQFTAPTNYSLDGVTLWTGSALLPFSTGTVSCDFDSKVTFTPQIVPKDQAGNKYGNGVAKNFYAIQVSIVNECPMAIVVPLAGIRVVVSANTVPHNQISGAAPTSLGVSTYSRLPSAGASAPYLASLSAFGGTPPYRWSAPQGSPLPTGLSLSSSGTISGTLASSFETGDLPFSVQVTDSSVPSLSATAEMVLPVDNEDTSAKDDCTEKGDLVAFSLDHVTSIFSADRKLTGRRAIYFNAVQALATLGSSVELFLPHGFAQGVAILGGGFTTASKDVLVDMSAEQLQNLTSQSFGSTEQVASHGSLQKFIFVRRSIYRKCRHSLTETELRHGEFTVNWELSPAAAEAPKTQTAPAQAAKDTKK